MKGVPISATRHTPRSLAALAPVLLGLATLGLAGCDLVRPAKKTTALEAREAMTSCGIDPDRIAWRVDGAGAFFYGRQSAGDEPLPPSQVECISQWGSDNRISVNTITWQDNER